MFPTASCGPGTYDKTPGGSATCALCAAGEYQPAYNATSCLNCPLDRNCTIEGLFNPKGVSQALHAPKHSDNHADLRTPETPSTGMSLEMKLGIWCGGVIALLVLVFTVLKSCDCTRDYANWFFTKLDVLFDNGGLLFDAV